MQIVPVISECGTKYRVRERSIFRYKYLCGDGVFLDIDDGIGRIIGAMEFNSVAEATKEIRKQFGKTADIQEWEPK